MRYFSILLITLFLIGCSTPEKKGNVTITGEIKGLKKGTLYLQKIKDTMLITIDSMIVPEIHFLYLDKDDGAQYNDRIDFFAEPGEITITTSLNDFEKDIRITGGENEMKFQEYKKMLKKFNERNLKLIKEDFEAKKQNDQDKLIANDKAYKDLVKQKYLYTINFAMFNKKLEIAPYVTLTEVYDANIKYLDTVARALPPKIKKSRYGEQLIVFIEERKEKEGISNKNE